MTTETDTDPSAEIDAIVRGLDDWRGERLRRLRALIHDAVPDVVEEIKWRKPSNPAGVPTWNHQGLLCTGEIYKDKVKLTFAHGASLPDPNEPFNSSLGGKLRRALDLREGDELEEAAFIELVQAAAEHNASA